MNKYQEALHKVKFIIDDEWGNGVSDKNEDIQVLQELVDKETPYKVDKYQMTGFAAVENCKCGKRVNELQRYCMHCGQALDWRKE